MRWLSFTLIALLLASCATVKRNGYYQTRRYNYGKHIIKEIPGKRKARPRPSLFVTEPAPTLQPMSWEYVWTKPSPSDQAVLPLPQSTQVPVEVSIDTDQLIQWIREGKIEAAYAEVVPLIEDRTDASSVGLIVLGVVLILLGLLMFLVDLSVRTMGHMVTSAIGVSTDIRPSGYFYFGFLFCLAGLAMLIIGIARYGY